MSTKSFKQHCTVYGMWMKVCLYWFYCITFRGSYTNLFLLFVTWSWLERKNILMYLVLCAPQGYPFIDQIYSLHYLYVIFIFFLFLSSPLIMSPPEASLSLYNNGSQVVSRNHTSTIRWQKWCGIAFNVNVHQPTAGKKKCIKHDLYFICHSDYIVRSDHHRDVSKGFCLTIKITHDFFSFHLFLYFTQSLEEIK